MRRRLLHRSEVVDDLARSDRRNRARRRADGLVVAAATSSSLGRSARAWIAVARAGLHRHAGHGDERAGLGRMPIEAPRASSRACQSAINMQEVSELLYPPTRHPPHAEGSRGPFFGRRHGQPVPAPPTPPRRCAPASWDVDVLMTGHEGGRRVRQRPQERTLDAKRYDRVSYMECAPQGAQRPWIPRLRRCARDNGRSHDRVRPYR